MSLPSEISSKVTEFEQERMAELAEAVNGDELSGAQRVMMKMVFRSVGYVHADLQAHIEDEEAHAQTGGSRKRQAGVVGAVSAFFAAATHGIRSALS